MTGVPGGPLTLTGAHVRLEPLDTEHIPGLLAAANESREQFQWSIVPQTRAEIDDYVAGARAAQDAGEMLPFATIRLSDGAVVGSTRFYDIERWRWPAAIAPEHLPAVDTAEIGYTWLAASAVRTACNTEAKLLMLTHAFETWRARRIALRTDVRNDVSRRAIERIGASLDGVLRADRPGSDGTVRDSAYYSIVAAEWPDVREMLRRRLNR